MAYIGNTPAELVTELDNGVVTTAKLADDAVTAAKIIDGTIISDDLNDGIITNAKVSASAAIAASKLAISGGSNITLQSDGTFDLDNTVDVTGGFNISGTTVIDGDERAYFTRAWIFDDSNADAIIKLRNHGTDAATRAVFAMSWSDGTTTNEWLNIRGHYGSKDVNIVGRSGANLKLTTDSNKAVDITAGALQVGGTTVLDSSRNADFTGLNVGGANFEPATASFKSDADHKAISIEENDGHESWQIGVNANGSLQFFNSDSTTPLLRLVDEDYAHIATNREVGVFVSTDFATNAQYAGLGVGANEAYFTAGSGGAANTVDFVARAANLGIETEMMRLEADTKAVKFTNAHTIRLGDTNGGTEPILYMYQGNSGSSEEGEVRFMEADNATGAGMSLGYNSLNNYIYLGNNHTIYSIAQPFKMFRDTGQAVFSGVIDVGISTDLPFVRIYGAEDGWTGTQDFGVIDSYEFSGNGGGIVINRNSGVNGGVDYFRDFYIGDGKGNQVAWFNGASGNAGIGVDKATSPRGRLELRKGADAAMGGSLALTNDTYTSGGSSTGIDFFITTGTTRDDAHTIRAYRPAYGNNYGVLLFETIDSDGKNERLAIGKTYLGDTSTVRISHDYTTNQFDGALELQTTNAQQIGAGAALKFNGYDDDAASSLRTFAKIIGRKANGTSGNYDGNIQFYTRVNGSGLTKALEITENQNLDVGAIPSANANYAQIQTAKPIHYRNISTSGSRFILSHGSASSTNASGMHRIEFWESLGGHDTAANANAAIEYDGSTAYGGDGALLIKGYTSAGAGGANTTLANFSRSGQVSFGPNNAATAGISSNARVHVQAGDLQLDNGYGINFSKTANSAGAMSSEVFDDYEEGTWTPVMKDGNTSGSATISFSSAEGWYTKVGRLVTCHGILASTSGGTGTGSIFIHGLPFAAGSSLLGATSLEGGGFFGYFFGLDTSSFVSVMPYENSTYAACYRCPGTGGDTDNLQAANINSGASLRFTIFYVTNT